jgi:hypothetical protein
MTMPKDEKTVRFVDLKRGVQEQYEDLEDQIQLINALRESVGGATPDAISLAEEVLGLVISHPSVGLNDFVYDAPAGEVPDDAVTLPGNDDDD